MIKLVVWDWNGTLFDDTELRHQLINDNLLEFGHKSLSFEQLQEHHYIPITRFYRNLGISDEEIEKHLPKMNKRYHEMYEVAVNTVPARPYAKETLEALNTKGVRSIICSNHLSWDIVKQLKRLKMDKYIADVLANDNIHSSAKQGKHDLLSDYLKQYNINPSTVLIVGDTEEETVIGKALGLKTAGLSGGIHTEARLRQENPDLLVHSLREIISAMEEL